MSTAPNRVLTRVSSKRVSSRIPSGNVTSAIEPARFSDPTWTCFRSRHRPLTDVTMDSRRINGTASFTGIISDRMGTAISPSPKPKAPRTNSAKHITKSIHNVVAPVANSSASCTQAIRLPMYLRCGLRVVLHQRLSGFNYRELNRNLLYS